MYRTRSTYPANYYPRYSEDPRYIGDPRYYGRGSPYSASQYGGQPPGKMNTGVIFGCAVFCVFIIIVTMGGLALGLALGLSGDSSSNTDSSSGDGGVPGVPTVAPVNPGDGTGTSNPDTGNPDSGNTDPLSIDNCPDNLQRFVSGGATTTIVDWPAVTTSGGSSGVTTLSENPPSGSAFPIGETTVNIVATDGPETVTCSFVVQVLQSGGSGPSSLSAICPNDIVMPAAAGETSVAVFWDAPTVLNANGVPTITYSRARGSSFSIGTTSVVATVTDASATVQCDFTVTVEDGGLTLECPDDMVVNTNTGETFATVNYPNPRVTGATSGILDIQFNPARNTPLAVGVTTVVATVTSGGNTAQCSFQIIVQDNEAPVLSSCDPGGDRSTDPGQSYATITWTTPTAVDNTGGTLPVTVSSNPGQFTVGRHTITAMATDSNDNVGLCTWTYDVSDEEPPAITCPASFTVRLLSGLPNVVVTYEDQVTASDNIASGVDINVNPSDIYPLERGTHTVIAMATDASGNSNSCSFTVTVADSCGVGAMTLTPRIIGGSVAQEGTYPWQVSLFQGRHFCGGVIIDENWILTAAHCFVPVETTGVTVIAGDNSLSTTSANRQTRSIAQVVNHPSYVTQPNHDISLLRLDQPLSITQHVLPACLSTTAEEQDLYDSDNCYVAGWGTVDPDATPENAVPEDNLRAVKLDDVISAQDCQPYHTLLDSSLCAGVLTGGRDACLGDSGGGLVCPDVDNIWHVIGIVSSGTGCAQANTLAVYSRVSQFLDFIHAYLGAELVVVDLSNGGSFSSGSNYPPNVVRGWRFRRFGGRTIRLEFPNFDLAAGDTLTLGHGLNPWDVSTVIMTMGSDFSLVTLEVDSSYTDIWFRFRSNGSGTDNGFVIRVEVTT